MKGLLCVCVCDTDTNSLTCGFVHQDGGGTISKDELGELMETLGINASQVSDTQ